MLMVSGVVGGVDTHADVHVAAAIDSNGGVLGVESFPTDGAGYERLTVWLGSFGPVARVGVEGTGSYGVGLQRHLFDEGIEVVEVDRANRQARRGFNMLGPTEGFSRSIGSGFRPKMVTHPQRSGCLPRGCSLVGKRRQTCTNGRE